MQKFTVKNILEFREKTDKTRQTFLRKLEREEKQKKERKEKKEKKDKSGGNYWVSCISAVSDVFSTGNKGLLEVKIEELYERIEYTEHKPTKSRWQRNIDILSNFEDFDFNTLKPNIELTFHKKSNSIAIVKIHDIPIEAKPHHVFSFKNKDNDEIGAIWFVAKKDGYKKSELGIYCDMMYRYLSYNYSEKYNISRRYCIIVDVYNGYEISYDQMINGDIKFLLDETIMDIKKLQVNDL